MAGRKGVSFPPTRFFRKEIRGCVFFANRLRAVAAYPRSGNIDSILFDVKLFAKKIIAPQAALPGLLPPQNRETAAGESHPQCDYLNRLAE